MQSTDIGSVHEEKTTMYIVHCSIDCTYLVDYNIIPIRSGGLFLNMYIIDFKLWGLANQVLTCQVSKYILKFGQ